jgi:UDP-N-acetylglucosamine--N-acetylmuramyl-(pentapeptide) pyrophosphoryl-undecaprenol N-acetylglucosamine transferase
LEHELVAEQLSAATVIHQCGATSIEEAREHAAQLPDDLERRYLLTDFVGPECPMSSRWPTS